MNKRGVGALFCLMAVLLFSARYIAAAIFMSGVSSWDSDLFNVGLDYVGPSLLILSIISLIVGIIYLVCAEASERKKSSNGM